LSVVIDANLLVVLALDDDRAPLVEAKLREWATAGETLHAPALLPYEAASALARAVVAGSLPAGAIDESWAIVTGVPVRLHALDTRPDVIAMAHRLGRQSAYDAAYLVLAQTLDADLWTLDGPLARNAAGSGLPVRLLSAR
jgi:predicted nucleic acid-binding protein